MKKKVTKVRLSDDLIEKLKFISEKEGYPVSTIISAVVADYVNFYLVKKKVK